MKKIFTFAFALMAMLALNAKETVVWTGNEPISWNPEVYAGSQFETPANTFSSLKEGYLIKRGCAPVLSAFIGFICCLCS